MQSLTPTLQESLEWRQSSASEASSVTNLARRSRLSSCVGIPARATDNASVVMQDDVFGDDDSKCPTNIEQMRNTAHEAGICSRDTSSFKIPTGKSLSRRHGMQTGEHCLKGAASSSYTCTPINRQNQSVLPDDDTPHLYRTKEAIQKSYAARHLASMREGSDSIDGSNLDTPDERHVPMRCDANGSVTSWLNHVKEREKEDSVCSIEMNRDMESPPPVDLCITNPKMCLTMSPEYNDSFTQKKRRYDCVEKSPISLRSSCNNSTGLTMEFQRCHVHSDQPAKRCNIEVNASPVRSMLSFQESLVSKTPDNPENDFIRQSIRLESPCTPPKLIPQSAFIHISSSPVLAKPCKSSSSQSASEKGVVSGACPPSNTSSVSLDSSLNSTKDGYLDISGTQTIPSSSPGADLANDTESSLGSELNNMSSVFFSKNKANSSQTTDDQLSNLSMSFSAESSQNNASSQVDTSLNLESTNESSAHAKEYVSQSVDEHVEHLTCKSPATSTPQNNCEQTNREMSGDNCKFPTKKPVNKLIKKVHLY